MTLCLLHRQSQKYNLRKTRQFQWLFYSQGGWGSVNLMGTVSTRTWTWVSWLPLQRSVFLAQPGGRGRQAHLPDAREHVRLSVIVPVGTHSQVHLLAVCVSFKGFCDSQDGVWGPHLHMGPPGAERGKTSVTETRFPWPETSWTCHKSASMHGCGFATHTVKQ